MYLQIILNIIPMLTRKSGVLFQDINSEKYIGREPSNGQLKLVEYKEAIRFKLEELSDISTKKMTDVKSNNIFTETGWWIFPKNFYMKDYTKDSKQGFQIVYYNPGEYILMRDGSCLSSKSGVFKKVNCKKGDVNIFKMCINRRCKDEMKELLKDVKMIKKALFPPMFPGMGFDGSFDPDGNQNGYPGNEEGYVKKNNKDNDWDSEKFKKQYGGSSCSDDESDESDSDMKRWKGKGGRGKRDKHDKRDSDSDSSDEFEKYPCIPINPWMLQNAMNHGNGGSNLNGFNPYGPMMGGMRGPYGPMMGGNKMPFRPYGGSNTNC